MNMKRVHARKERKRKRIRKKIFGTSQRPRLTVNRSNANIYAQVIDDTVGNTLACSSSLDSACRNVEGDKKSVAEEVGKLLAGKCEKNGIKEVVFDKNIYKYHGRVKALADGARKGGLQF